MIDRALPRFLQVWAVVPATLALVIIGGTAFTLPPGPLSDEGMALFMEGGCDWGDSNIFFFCKLGLLVALNLVFAGAWLAGVRGGAGFVPHFSVLAALTLFNLSGGRCDSYYAHPNGSIGQMTLEAMAFAYLGLCMLSIARVRSVLRLAGALVIWNAIHVAVFYLGLTFTDHWTWTHTFFIVATLSALGAALRLTPAAGTARSHFRPDRGIAP